MRSLGFGLAFSAAILGLAFGCGHSEGDSATPGGAGSSATAGSSSAGTSTGKAGSSAMAGSATSGSSSGGSVGGSAAGGGAAATGGQPDAQAGTGSDGGSAVGLVDCDPKKIFCKRAAPVCAAGQVPSVDGTCYGDCVKVDECACNAADQCPQPEEYTCWAKQHCGPYVR